MCWLAVLLLVEAPKNVPAVAMVLDTKGTVTLIRGQDPPVQVGDSDLLRSGDRLQFAQGAEASLLIIKDMQTEHLAGGKQVTVGEAGCQPGGAVKKREQSKLPERLKRDLQDDLRSGRLGGVILRGQDPNQPTPLLSPLPGTNILTRKPTFSWPAVKDAQGYIIELYTGSNGMKANKLWRVETTENRLPFPENKEALEPVLHRWSVVAKFKNDEQREVVPVKQAEFTVLLPREVELLKTVEGMAKGDRPHDLLLAASLYETRAVLDEALSLYEQLAKLRPDDAPLQEVLARYYDHAGRSDRAKAAREKAARLRKPAGEK